MKWRRCKLEHLSLIEMKEALASMRYQPATEEIFIFESKLRKLLKLLWGEEQREDRR